MYAPYRFGRWIPERDLSRMACFVQRATLHLHHLVVGSCPHIFAAFQALRDLRGEDRDHCFACAVPPAFMGLPPGVGRVLVSAFRDRMYPPGLLVGCFSPEGVEVRVHVNSLPEGLLRAPRVIEFWCECFDGAWILDRLAWVERQEVRCVRN